MDEVLSSASSSKDLNRRNFSFSLASLSAAWTASCLGIGLTTCTVREYEKSVHRDRLKEIYVLSSAIKKYGEAVVERIDQPSIQDVQEKHSNAQRVWKRLDIFTHLCTVMRERLEAYSEGRPKRKTVALYREVAQAWEETVQQKVTHHRGLEISIFEENLNTSKQQLVGVISKLNLPSQIENRRHCYKTLMETEKAYEVSIELQSYYCSLRDDYKHIVT